eukprot:scaffold11.g4031.t1
MSSRSGARRDSDYRRGGDRDRPSSRAADSRDGGGRAGGPPPRAAAPHNPLLAEVARLAKQRMEAEKKAAASAAAGEALERPGDRGGWRAAMEEEQGGGAKKAAPAEPAPASSSEEAEDGELRPDGAPVGAPPAAEEQGRSERGGDERRDDRLRQQQRGGEDREGGRKRKHEPIVWRPGGGGGGAAAASPPGERRSPAPRSPPARGATASDIAAAELEAFRRRQEAEAGGGAGEDELRAGGYMKASPSVSSPEEEMHIIRERTSLRDSAPPHQDDADSRKRSRWAEAEAAPAGGGEIGAAAAAGDQGAAAAAEGPPAGEEAEARGREGDAGDAAAEGEQEEREEEAGEPRFRRPATMLADCRSVDHYEKLNRISEGTYGVVYRARERESGAICALKKASAGDAQGPRLPPVKLDKEREGFPLTSVREINILLSLDHPNIVGVSEVVVGASLDSVFMVMEYADHDLRGLLSGVAYLHERWVLHRDLKTSNILYTNRGMLKICDFGLARQYGSPLKPYTHCVVTLWYRAPELLLGQKVYSTAVDVWSCGCILGELLSKEPLIQGKNEIDQLQHIFALLSHWRKFNFRAHPRMAGLRQRFPPPGLVFDGSPALSEAGFDLLSRLLDPCPERRISAQDAMEHPWFREHPLPKDPALMPTFPPTNEALHGHRAAAAAAAQGR